MLATKWSRRLALLGSFLAPQTCQRAQGRKRTILTEIVEILEIFFEKAVSANVLELFFDVGGQIARVVGLEVADELGYLGTKLSAGI